MKIPWRLCLVAVCLVWFQSVAEVCAKVDSRRLTSDLLLQQSTRSFFDGETVHTFYSSLCKMLHLDSLHVSVSNAHWQHASWGEPYQHMPMGAHLDAHFSRSVHVPPSRISIDEDTPQQQHLWNALVYALDSAASLPFALASSSSSPSFNSSNSSSSWLHSSKITEWLDVLNDQHVYLRDLLMPIGWSSRRLSVRDKLAMYAHVHVFSNGTAKEAFLPRVTPCSHSVRSLAFGSKFDGVPSFEYLFENKDVHYVGVSVTATATDVTLRIQWVEKSSSSASSSSSSSSSSSLQSKALMDHRLEAPLIVSTHVSGTGQEFGILEYRIRCTNALAAAVDLPFTQRLRIATHPFIDFDWTRIETIGNATVHRYHVHSSYADLLVSLNQCVRSSRIRIPMRKLALSTEQYGPEAHHGLELAPASFGGRFSPPAVILGLRPDPSFVYNTYLLFGAMLVMFLGASYNALSGKFIRDLFFASKSSDDAEKTKKESKPKDD